MNGYARPIKFFTLAIFCMFSCSEHRNAKDSIKKENFAVIDFKETFYDFGKVHDGDTVSHDFSFQNTGNSALLINDVSTGCGCTAVEWPKSPINPKSYGKIKLTFSKHHDTGMHYKRAVLRSNTENKYDVLVIKAIVED